MVKISNKKWGLIALLPALIVGGYFIWGFGAYTAYLSFTDSTFLPSNTWVGLKQYRRLFYDDVFWLSFKNMFIYGSLYLIGCIVIGAILAILLDCIKMGETLFRTIILYPMSVSLIVTGIAWQWFLNPTSGLEKIVRGFGFEGFEFRWIVDSDMSIYVIVLGALWHGIGLIMILFLSGIKSTNPEIWHSARLDGIPAHRVYTGIILPQLRPILLTAVILLAFNVVRSFDIVAALTGGGPGRSSIVPAMYVFDYFFDRSKIAQGAAAAVIMVLTTIIIVAPYLIHEVGRKGDT